MIYEYKCSACGHEWEKEAPITSDPETRCPKCGQEKAKRLVSLTHFVLKGPGWASDGYK